MKTARFTAVSELTYEGVNSVQGDLKATLTKCLGMYTSIVCYFMRLLFSGPKQSFPAFAQNGPRKPWARRLHGVAVQSSG